jgi:SAM-dependent methyltransferase
MTLFETIRIVADPFLPPLATWVRADLRRLLATLPTGTPRLLDVGARRSPYTIGLPARVTMLDVPRADELQRDYDLGLEGEALTRLRRRRSNVEEIRLEDFLSSSLEGGRFDVATAIEVIEHIDDDETFVGQLARVLGPEGVAYLTTPNGDAMPVPPPQHVRHYTKAHLVSLCTRHFGEVEVHYGIRRNRLHELAHGGYEARRPWKAVRTMCANAAYRFSPGGEGEDADGTAHLFAVLRRPLGH